jgi:6-phosphogluconolactonase (cycloisomerase 2 family)
MFAYVGSFTTQDRSGRGSGIEVYRVDPGDGGLTRVQTIDGLENPSFLAIAGDRPVLYAVHGGRAYASAYALDAGTGHATPLGRASTGGNNGVRQDFDAAARFMVVANYVSGNVSVLGIGPDGALVDHHDVLYLGGQLGPHRVEQARPQPHDVAFDPSRRFVIIPDKGLDAVFVLAFDPEKGRLGLHRSVASRVGAGPRHVAFHPTLPFAYVCNELDSTVAVQGALTPIQVVSSLPDDVFAPNTTSELAFGASGRVLYCSNRGHDSIALFAIDPANGKLTGAGWQKTGGAEPRFIGADPTGRFLYAANQNSDDIVVFAIDPATGALTPTGARVSTRSPVTIAFLGGF